MSKKTFQIWSEGFAATGESEKAHFYGYSQGETFNQACLDFRDSNGAKLGLDLNKDGALREEYPSIWACRLYDNESDARKNYG